MTTQLIRMMAKEIAGEVYDGQHFPLSERFRVENPDQRVFVAYHWPHYVNEAKSRMIKMLAHPAVTQNEKDVILEELIEHAERSESPHAKQLLQVSLQPREREDIKHVDNNPELRSVGA